jgi:hypothetical protein
MAQVQVGAADAAALHLDQHLAFAGSRLRNVLDAQFGVLADDGFHGAPVCAPTASRDVRRDGQAANRRI